MRFAPTEEQELLRKSVADVLKRTCTPDDVRAAWSAEGRSRERWVRLAELGVVGMLVPEAHGGLGMTALDLALVLEEAGRAALPEPLLETAAIAAPILAEAGDDGTRARWLEPILAGVATAAVALEGQRAVAEAPIADVTIVARGGALFAVPREALAFVPERSVDGARRVATIAGEPPAGTRFADGELARAAVRTAWLRGALAASAELVGLSRAMLEQAVEYAKVRQQFGAAIGSFQAVKHHLADALVAIELARPVVLHAAYSLAHGAPDAALRVSHAKATASDAATLVAKKALQCHGAIGYSFEHSLHLWMKRAWALARAWGDGAEHRARVARVLLDGLPLEEA